MSLPEPPIRPASGCIDASKRRQAIEANAAHAKTSNEASSFVAVLEQQNLSGLAVGSDSTSAHAARLVSLATESPTEVRSADSTESPRSLNIDLSGNKFRRCDELCEAMSLWATRLGTQQQERMPPGDAACRPQLELNLSGNPLKHQSSKKLAQALSQCKGIDINNLDLSKTNALNESGPWREFFMENAKHHQKLVTLQQAVRAEQQKAREQRDQEAKQFQLGSSLANPPSQVTHSSPLELSSLAQELQSCSSYEGVRIRNFRDDHESYNSSQVFPLLRCIAASPTLVSLSLSDCRLENEAMNALAEGLDGSCCYDLADSSEGSTAIGGMTFTLSSLRSLSLSNNRIGSDGLRLLCLGIIRRHQAWFAKADNKVAKKLDIQVNGAPPSTSGKRVTVEAPTSSPSSSFLQRDASIDEIIAVGKTMVYRSAVSFVNANKHGNVSGRRARGTASDQPVFPIQLESLNLRGNRIGHVPADSDHVREGHLTPSTMVRSTASLASGRGGDGGSSAGGMSLSSRAGAAHEDSASLGGWSSSSGKVIILRGLPRIPECSSAIAPPDCLDPLPPPGAPLAYDPSGLLSLSVVCRLCQHSLRTLDITENHLGEGVEKSVVSGLGSGRVLRLPPGKDHGGVVEVCEAMRSCTKFLGNGSADQQGNTLDYIHRSQVTTTVGCDLKPGSSSGNGVSIKLVQGNSFSDESLSAMHRASGLLVQDMKV